MITISQRIEFDTANAEFGLIDLTRVDDLHYSYEPADGSDATLTGAVSMRFRLDQAGGVVATAALDLSAGVHTINVEKYAWGSPVIVTVEAGRAGALRFYGRCRPFAAGA